MATRTRNMDCNSCSQFKSKSPDRSRKPSSQLPHSSTKILKKFKHEIKPCCGVCMSIIQSGRSVEVRNPDSKNAALKKLLQITLIDLYTILKKFEDNL
jgi:hypothetical protein